MKNNRDCRHGDDCGPSVGDNISDVAASKPSSPNIWAIHSSAVSRRRFAASSGADNPHGVVIEQDLSKIREPGEVYVACK